MVANRKNHVNRAPQFHSFKMRFILSLLLGLSACSHYEQNVDGPGPIQWEQQWLRRSVIDKTKEQAENNLFEWVQNYGRRAGYEGPVAPIPDEVILPSGELVWKRFNRIEQLGHSDLGENARNEIKKKLSRCPDAVYSRREADGSIVVFFRDGFVDDYLFF